MSDDNEVKVVDKRPFTSEGELKEEVEGKASSVEPPEGREDTGEPESGQADPQLPPKPDFSSFIVILYTSGAINLGLIKLPEESERVDLPAAKQTIDLIELLKEKTSGNLTVRESKLLEDLLAQLQLAFVNQWEKER